MGTPTLILEQRPREGPSLLSGRRWSCTAWSSGGKREPHTPSWNSQHPSQCPPSSPLQFLAVIQQRLQVGEPESTIEAVSVRPGLADVGVFLVEVL